MFCIFNSNVLDYRNIIITNYFKDYIFVINILGDFEKIIIIIYKINSLRMYRAIQLVTLKENLHLCGFIFANKDTLFVLNTLYYLVLTKCLTLKLSLIYPTSFLLKKIL